MKMEHIQILNRMDSYCNTMKSIVGHLKTATFMGKEDEVGQLVAQIRVLLNEINQEILSLRKVGFKDALVEKQVNQRLLEILIEANKIVKQKHGWQ